MLSRGLRDFRRSELERTRYARKAAQHRQDVHRRTECITSGSPKFQGSATVWSHPFRPTNRDENEEAMRITRVAAAMGLWALPASEPMRTGWPGRTPRQSCRPRRVSRGDIHRRGCDHGDGPGGDDGPGRQPGLRQTSRGSAPIFNSIVQQTGRGSRRSIRRCSRPRSSRLAQPESDARESDQGSERSRADERPSSSTRGKNTRRASELAVKRLIPPKRSRRRPDRGRRRAGRRDGATGGRRADAGSRQTGGSVGQSDSSHERLRPWSSCAHAGESVQSVGHIIGLLVNNERW